MRFVDGVNTLERTLLRPSATYRGNGFSLAGGYDLHIVNSPDDRLEHTLWQQIGTKWNLEPISITARTRLEERFIENVDGTALRLRLRARAEMPLGWQSWYVAVSEEVFFNLNSLSGGPQSGFNQNRVFGGLGTSLSESVGLEFGYQMQYISRTNEDVSIHQLVLSFSF